MRELGFVVHSFLKVKTIDKKDKVCEFCCVWRHKEGARVLILVNICFYTLGHSRCGTAILGLLVYTS